MAANCSLVSATVESDIETGHGDDHSDHEHGEEVHGEEVHGEEAHGEEVHSEFAASYEFDCANPEQLNQIEVGLFDLFPGIEEIEVQGLTDAGQVGAELTPSQSTLS